MAVCLGLLISRSVPQRLGVLGENKPPMRTVPMVLLVIVGVSYCNAKSLLTSGYQITDVWESLSRPVYLSYISSVSHSTERQSDLALSLYTAITAPFFWFGLYALLTEARAGYRKALWGVGTLLLCYAALVINKGSDKEIVEIVTFLLLLRYVWRGIRLRVRTVASSIIIIFVLLFTVGERKEGRVDGSLCFESYCATSEAIENLPAPVIYLSGYLTQGLKGLEVAVGSNWITPPTLCLGPIMQAVHASLGVGCSGDSYYIKQIDQSGVWTTKGRWESFFVWLGGSLGGLLFVPAWVFLHAFVFGWAARKLKHENSFPLFVFVFYSFVQYVYFPANSQVFLSLDSMVIYLFALAFTVRKALNDIIPVLLLRKLK